MKYWSLFCLCLCLMVGSFSHAQQITTVDPLNPKNMDAPQLIYVGDPMCSWCYGFGPQLDQLRTHYKDIDFVMVMGGLRPGTTEPMDQELKGFLKHHWEEIGQRTGLPFNMDLLQPDVSFVYNTEPPARAVVVVRHLKPEAGFDFFTKVQKAFYQDNKNTAAVQTYLDLLPEGVDPKEFQSLFSSIEAKKAVQNDFQVARSMGVTGFPSTLLRVGNELFPIAYGFSDANKMIKQIDQHLKKK